MKFCLKCGKSIPDESEFCLYCGTVQKTTDNHTESRQGNEKTEEPVIADNRKKNKKAKSILTVILSLLCGAALATAVFLWGIPYINNLQSGKNEEKSVEIDTDPSSDRNIKSYEELVAEAETIEVYDLLGDVEDNVSRAEKKHLGKTYIIVDGYVRSVYKDHLLYQSYDKTNGRDTFRMGWVFTYFANEDEFLSISKDDSISIIGIVTKVTGSGVTLKNAYIYRGK